MIETFGRYPQAKTGVYIPIDWIVLDRHNGKELLLSKYALELLHFDKRGIAETWNQSSLCQFLNEDFIKKAFNAEERCQILGAEKLKDSYILGYQYDVTEELFVLSKQEFLHFVAPDDKCCYITPHAENYRLIDWWLRDVLPEKNNMFDCGLAKAITRSGEIHEAGYLIAYEAGVRIAMWKYC